MRHDEVVGALLGDDGRLLSWSRDAMRLWDIGWPAGTLPQIACSVLLAADLGEVSQRYGVEIEDPICDSRNPIADPDWSRIERAPAG
jgi:hypothetical protein